MPTACRRRSSRPPRERAPAHASLALAQIADEARRIETAAALGLHPRIELVDERGDRKGRTPRPRFGETQSQVLAHPVDGEAEVELVGQHRAAPIFHLPRLGGTLADPVSYTHLTLPTSDLV